MKLIRIHITHHCIEEIKTFRSCHTTGTFLVVFSSFMSSRNPEFVLFGIGTVRYGTVRYGTVICNKVILFSHHVCLLCRIKIRLFSILNVESRRRSRLDRISKPDSKRSDPYRIGLLNRRISLI